MLRYNVVHRGCQSTSIIHHSNFMNLLYAMVLVVIVMLAALMIGWSGKISGGKHHSCLAAVSGEIDRSTCQRPEYNECKDSQSTRLMIHPGIYLPFVPDDYHSGDYSSAAGYPGENNSFQDTTTYQSVEAVESPPKLIWMKYPELPEVMPDKAPRQEIILKVLVDNFGRPVDVILGGGQSIDEKTAGCAIEAARTSQFKPALINNRPVRCWVEVPIHFYTET